MNKASLIVRLAIVVTFAALTVGLISTQIFYQIQFQEETHASRLEIEQLNKTVAATASIATYLEDRELVNEVINGLTSNNIVQGVAITTDKLTSQSENYVENKSTLHFNLTSPFEPDRQVGVMSITPDTKMIEDKAQKVSYDTLIAVIIQAGTVIIVVIVTAFFVVTRPILSLVKKLHKLTPGSKARLEVPKYHNFSELGVLTQDINLLLGRVEEHIAEERILRNQIELISRHFKLLFENSNSPIILAETDGNIILYNNAFRQFIAAVGVPLAKSYGPYLRDLFVEQSKLDNLVELAYGNKEVVSGEFEITTNKGNEVKWVHLFINSATTENFKEYYQITLHDISNRRLKFEQLDKKAKTDELTQLLNRRGAETEIESLISTKTPFYLLLLDLNKFKPINDIYGHDAGDEVLNHVSTQLTKCLRRRDILSRWGGDEFVIVLPNLSKSEVTEVTDKVIQHIEKPYFLTSHNTSVTVGASIGIAGYPTDAHSYAKIIKSADKAMYWTKNQKQDASTFHFFSNGEISTSKISVVNKNG